MEMGYLRKGNEYNNAIKKYYILYSLILIANVLLRR